MIRRLPRALVAGLLLAVFLAAPAYAEDELTVESIDTSDLPTVSITVTLPASMAGQTPDADDFAVLVDGKRPRVDVYAGVQLPLEVVLVIDTSGSMDGAPIDQAREAAKAFVAAMPDTAAVTVIAFGDTAEVVAGPGDDATEAIAALDAEGETALYDAIGLAAEAFQPGVDTRRVMIVLSDGGDTASEATLADAISDAAAAEADVHAVALNTEDSDRTALAGIAPGGVITADSAAELVGLYAQLAVRLTGTYRLEFDTDAAGTTDIHVVIDAGIGVVSTILTVDFPEAPGSIVSRPSDSTSPAATVVVPDATVVKVDVETLSRGWTLYAGVALVFLGALIALWLTLRGKEESPIPVLQGPERERKPGIIGAIAELARGLGDKIADRSSSKSSSGETTSIDSSLDRAGIALRPGEFIVVSGTAIVVAVLAGVTLAGIPGAVALGAIAAAAPRTVLRTLTERRRRAFAEQLEGTLQMIAGSLRAGYGLTQAISTVAEESPSPTDREFNRVVVENRLGRTIELSLRAMAHRMQNEDLDWVVEAIEIQHEVGGDLAEVLDTVTATIRDRNLIRRQVKALSAEGRISAFILLALPFAIAGFISIISPDYLAELTNTGMGQVMLGIAALMMAAGAAWIRKIIKVDF